MESNSVTLDDYRKVFEQNSNAAKPCPSCGHCPTCGRRNVWVQPMPYVYPIYPGVYTQPYPSPYTITFCGTTY